MIKISLQWNTVAGKEYKPCPTKLAFENDCCLESFELYMKLWGQIGFEIEKKHIDFILATQLLTNVKHWF